MTQLPKKVYQVLGELLDLLSYTAKDKEKEIGEFEKTLLIEFADSVVKKLPEHKRSEIVELINKAGKDKEARVEMNKKLRFWLNDKEATRLLNKVADNLFKDYLAFVYKKVDKEKKEKIKAVFKVEELSL